VWRAAASAILLTGLVLDGVRAGEVSSKHTPDVAPALVSPYQHYDLKLRAFYPVPRCPAGVLLIVRINGGRPLRLLLDSGAEFIVIGAKEARSANLSTGTEMDLVGLETRSARVGWAQTVEIGPVSFRNCRVAFVNGGVIEGADGVIPLSLFSQFLLRLDLPHKTLGLIPYEQEGDPADFCISPAIKHDLPLLATVLNGKQSGYVMVDTGAFCSAISRAAARALGGSQPLPDVRLTTGTGSATGQHVPSPVHFAVADQDFVPNDVVALDLSNLSRHYGLEVLGVLGFPALDPYVLTIDYHHHRVMIQPPRSISAQEQHRSNHAVPPAALALR